MAKRTASTLQFLNSIFCEVKYEREEDYKESGMFSLGKRLIFWHNVCVCMYMPNSTILIVELDELNWLNTMALEISKISDSSKFYEKR